ncbi:histone acetyltransferase-2 [Coleophoma crateriformis]|uniref:histone acetyltransferase n=1 Tax=Coleophoma crateriformis TaxID=565419 RepID=A0A3D8RI58_9HELO|nr:histone acetyltransferase-2 [Coleophoma crateriformis]
MPGLTATAQSRQQAHARRMSKTSSSSSGVMTTTTNTSKSSMDAEKEKLRERNIEQVIFGNIAFKAWYPSYYPASVLMEGGKSRGEGDSIEVGKGIVVPRLYVCNRCFAYGREVIEWWKHVRCCERENLSRGRKIYTHGEGSAWTVWEVDGSVETLFCQNLSLFAKLFLDNKSVFFDVYSFNYFLLVHTPPSNPAKPQIVGFFSKEKMSWDNNNLACILIFPPWQKKGLGALLMAVSYEISRREGILGGPEKPISDLGRKGYKRYWGGEIARWLLEVKETDRKKGRGMVDVESISKETWIAADDCLAVLREMGIVEKAGRGKGTVERVRIDKVRVREWVDRNKISLDRQVDSNGFVDGYAERKEVVGD